jgi:hypothetical protein
MKHLTIALIIVASALFVGCEDSSEDPRLAKKTEVVQYKNDPTYSGDRFEVVTTLDNIIRITDGTLVRVLRDSGSGLSTVRAAGADDIRTGDTIEYTYDLNKANFERRTFKAIRLDVY